MLMGWKRLWKDVKDYPVLEVDEFYTEWYKKMMRQIKLDGWERIIDLHFVNNTIRVGSDSALLKL